MHISFKLWAGIILGGLLIGLTAWGAVHVWPAPAEEPGTLTPVASPVVAPPLFKPVAEAKTAAANSSGHPLPDRLLQVTAARLHAEALERFYSSPQFGKSRMPPVYEKVVKEWKPLEWSPGDLDQPTVVPFLKDLLSIHGETVGNFLKRSDKPATAKAPGPDAPVTLSVNQLDVDSLDAATLASLNVIRIGNKPGQVASGREKNWEVKNIDLVGLLLNDQPTVYVSEKIPDMKKLGTIPTRELDAFELTGLDSLRRGENLFVRSQEGVIRVLGAVRAKQDCLKCHAGSKEGDLFGAFSYTVRQAEYRMRSGWGRPTGPTPGASTTTAPKS